MWGFKEWQTYTLEEVQTLDDVEVFPNVLEKQYLVWKEFDKSQNNFYNEQLAIGASDRFINEIRYIEENQKIDLQKYIWSEIYSTVLNNIENIQYLKDWFFGIDTINEYNNFIIENSWSLAHWEKDYWIGYEDNVNNFYEEDKGFFNNVEDSEWLIDRFKNIAIQELWNNENDGSADKYWQEMWYPKRISKWDKNAWCGMYVSWVLKKAWYSNEWKNWLAGSFIGIDKVWYHVWIKTDGMLLSWNFRNKVGFWEPWSNANVVWWRMPWEPNKIHREKTNFSDIPEWAIVVFDGSKSTK